MATIIPAILSDDPSMIHDQCAAASVFTDTVQIDLCDGIYVSGLTYPFVHSDATISFPANLNIELDCMFWSPEDYVQLFQKLQPVSVIIHIETVLDRDALITMLEQLPGVSVSVSCRNTTDISDLYTWIDSTDIPVSGVQVMGINQIGQQGQPFDQACIARITELRRRYPQLQITVDGGMSSDTISLVIDAGADRCVVGSVLWNSDDVASQYRTLSLL